MAAQNRKTQAAFECMACGHAENADRNAAKNILAKAHQMMAAAQGRAQGLQAGQRAYERAGRQNRRWQEPYRN